MRLEVKHVYHTGPQLATSLPSVPWKEACMTAYLLLMSAATTKSKFQPSFCSWLLHYRGREILYKLRYIHAVFLTSTSSSTNRYGNGVSFNHAITSPCLLPHHSIQTYKLSFQNRPPSATRTSRTSYNRKPAPARHHQPIRPPMASLQTLWPFNVPAPWFHPDPRCFLCWNGQTSLENRRFGFLHEASVHRYEKDLVQQ